LFPHACCGEHLNEMKKYTTLYLILVHMLTTVDLAAQRKSVQLPGWKIAGVLPAANGQPPSLGVAGPVAGVHHNVLLVAGGANFPAGMPWLGGKKKYYNEGFVFRKDETDSLVFMKAFQLPSSLGYAATCSTPEGVIAAGGENEAGLHKDVLLLQWNAAAQTIVVKNLPVLPFTVTNASLAYHRNKLYLAGGERTADVSDELLVLDLSDTASGWKSLPSLPRPVSHAVMVIQSNGKEDCLYLLGGRKRNAGGLSDLYASAYQFDLKRGAWTEKRSLPYAMSAGTGVATGSNFILLFGGDTGETFHKTEGLIAAIGKETEEGKKQQLAEEKTAVQATHPGFCRQVLLYDAKKNRWSPSGCIPFAAPVTTTAVEWNGKVFIPSGEIKAGVRTPEILVADLANRSNKF
jgi:N-acetylneuraminate epimerase